MPLITSIGDETLATTCERSDDEMLRVYQQQCTQAKINNLEIRTWGKSVFTVEVELQEQQLTMLCIIRIHHLLFLSVK